MTQSINIPGIGPVDFPDDMGDADIVAAIKRNYPNLDKYKSAQFPVKLGAEGMAQSLREEAASRTIPGQMLAGVGTSVNDAAMRLKQLTGGALTPLEHADILAGRQLRQVSAPAMFGGIGGQVAMTYPVAPATFLGNVAAGGAIGGLIEPTVREETTLGNIKRGAVGGGLGYGAVKGLGMLAQPIAQSAAVKKLTGENIIPTPGQAARSTDTFVGRTLGGVEDAVTSFPVLGDLVKGARTRGIQELNEAALRRATPAGTAPSATIGREAIEATGDAVSDAYRVALDKIGTVSLDQRFLNSAPQIVQRAVALNPAQRADVASVVEQVISSRVNPAQGTVSADVAKIIDSDLGSYVRDYSRSSVASERQAAGVIQEVQKSWRDLIRRNAPDVATAKQLDNANRAFANLLRVEKASIKSTLQGGEFTAAQLNQAVRELTPNKRQFAKGKALMQDLSEPAAQVLTGRLGESGTIPRGLIGLGILGGGGTALNQQLEGPDWVTKLMLGMGLLGPLYTRAGSRYMIGDLVPRLQQPIAQGAGLLSPYAAQVGRSYMLNQ